MKVLTLNTHSWLEDHQEHKLNQLVEQIISASYDIIALQEVNQLTSDAVVTSPVNLCETKEQMPIKQSNFAYVIVKKLAEQGYKYYWSYAMSHIGYDLYDEGSALLSKTPIQPHAQFVSRERDPDDYHSRKILFGITTVDDREVLAASCHYSWWIDESNGFSYEWNNTVEQLMTYPQPKLIMGDFNNPENTAGYQYVLESNARLQDTYMKASKKTGHHTIEKNIAGWEENGGQLRIDFIWSTKDFDVMSHQTVFDGRNTEIISDHFGVEAELK